jgi:hypothetical protein
MWQFLTFGIIAGIAFFAVTRMKKLGAAAQSSYAAILAKLRADFAASRRAGESDAAFVMASTRNKLKKNQGFFVALTNERLLLQDLSATGAPMRAFDRAQVSVSAPRKKWTDQGNMQTTFSEGWELTINLPGNESYSGLRLYDRDAYFAEQGQHVPIFLSALGQG